MANSKHGSGFVLGWISSVVPIWSFLQVVGGGVALAYPPVTCVPTTLYNTVGANSFSVERSGIRSLVHVGHWNASGQDCVRVSSLDMAVERGSALDQMEIGWSIGWRATSGCYNDFVYAQDPVVFMVRRDLPHGTSCFSGNPATYLNPDGDVTFRVQNVDQQDGTWTSFLYQSAQQFHAYGWAYTEGLALTNGEHHYCCSAWAHFMNLEYLPSGSSTYQAWGSNYCWQAGDPVYRFLWVDQDESKVDTSGVVC